MRVFFHPAVAASDHKREHVHVAMDSSSVQPAAQHERNTVSLSGVSEVVQLAFSLQTHQQV